MDVSNWYHQTMKISHGTRINDIETSNGYGYATVNMIYSLDRLGYEYAENDPTADVEIWFDQPHHWKFSKGPYRIGYHPWESTQLKKGWVDIMNQCDEIWTPSPLIADWYTKYAGIKVPVYVYEHGVDPIWKSVPRQPVEQLKFLHCGAEAARKGAKEAMQALRLAFPREMRDVSLTMKVITPGWKIGELPRIHIENSRLNLNELVKLFHDHHVYVYPSYGEGFGLTPLQALATGMPTITVPEWAPYADFLDPNLSLSSKMVRSPWPGVHPGNMLQPSMDDLIEAMRYCYSNYDEVHKRAQYQVDALLERYDWDKLTSDAFTSLAERL